LGVDAVSDQGIEHGFTPFLCDFLAHVLAMNVDAHLGHLGMALENARNQPDKHVAVGGELLLATRPREEIDVLDHRDLVIGLTE
jgi:hypothetical protein